MVTTEFRDCLESTRERSTAGESGSLMALSAKRGWTSIGLGDLEDQASVGKTKKNAVCHFTSIDRTISNRQTPFASVAGNVTKIRASSCDTGARRPSMDA